MEYGVDWELDEFRENWTDDNADVGYLAKVEHDLAAVKDEIERLVFVFRTPDRAHADEVRSAGPALRGAIREFADDVRMWAEELVRAADKLEQAAREMRLNRLDEELMAAKAVTA
jgi:hypothetical protein